MNWMKLALLPAAFPFYAKSTEQSRNLTLEVTDRGAMAEGVKTVDNRASCVKMLFEAAFSGDKGRVVEVFNHGAEASVQDTNGLTPLHYAAMKGHGEIVQFLLEIGAYIGHYLKKLDYKWEGCK